jgi:adenylylsulfate kinase
MRADRAAARQIMSQGEFLEVFCDTPIETCEQRDVKGLYRKARAGMIAEFTGISSPYEPPVDPELRVATNNKNIDACADDVLELLRERGVIPAEVGPAAIGSGKPRSRAA